MTLEVQSFVGNDFIKKKITNEHLVDICREDIPIPFCSGSSNEKEYQIVSTLKKDDDKEHYFQSFCKYQAILKFNRGETISKMLYDSPRNGRSITAAKADLSRFNCELDQLYCKGSIDASSASFLFPEKQKKLFRDIGFILDEQKCILHSAYTEDVFTRVLDINGRECEWSASLHSFVVNDSIYFNDEYGKKTDSEGEFRATNGHDRNTLDLSVAWKDRLISISASSDKKRYNEIVISYDQSSILGILISDYRYIMNAITSGNMKLDALLVQDAFFNSTRSRLPIYLLESVTGELSLFVDT